MHGLKGFKTQLLGGKVSNHKNLVVSKNTTWWEVVYRLPTQGSGFKIGGKWYLKGPNDYGGKWYLKGSKTQLWEVVSRFPNTRTWWEVVSKHKNLVGRGITHIDKAILIHSNSGRIS